MNPTLKTQWTAALRSGEYMQGRGHFKTREGHYCCLGVLCMVLNRPDLMQLNSVHTERFDDYGGLFGISRLFPDQGEALWRLNDVTKLTFNEIADWIETHVEETSTGMLTGG